MNIQSLEAEVNKIANERTPELLAKLLDVLSKREALNACKRHQYYPEYHLFHTEPCTCYLAIWPRPVMIPFKR